eukprot:1149744-Pelagomonas_calceolata.AAC.7
MQCCTPCQQLPVKTSIPTGGLMRLMTVGSERPVKQKRAVSEAIGLKPVACFKIKLAGFLCIPALSASTGKQDPCHSSDTLDHDADMIAGVKVGKGRNVLLQLEFYFPAPQLILHHHTVHLMCTPTFTLCHVLRVCDEAMLEDAVEDPHASRVLLQLLCPNSRRYLPPAVLTMLHPPQRTVVGTSGNMVTDIEGDEDELAGGVGEAHGFGVTGDDEDGGDGDDFLQLKAPAAKKGKSKGDGKDASKKGKQGEGGKQGQQGTGNAGKADEEEEEEGVERKGGWSCLAYW